MFNNSNASFTFLLSFGNNDVSPTTQKFDNIGLNTSIILSLWKIWYRSSLSTVTTTAALIGTTSKWLNFLLEYDELTLYIWELEIQNLMPERTAGGAQIRLIDEREYVMFYCPTNSKRTIIKSLNKFGGKPYSFVLADKYIYSDTVT